MPGSNNKNAAAPHRGFSIASLACAAAALPLARLAPEWFGPSDDPMGYYGLGIALMVLMITLVPGVILGLNGLRRGEQPRYLPALATILNAAGILWLFTGLRY